MTISITENRTHIKQMKDDYEIATVKKSEIADFGVEMGRLRLAFIKKDGDKVYFYFVNGIDKAIADLLLITEKMRF